MSSAKTTIPTVECKVIGNIDWDGFINYFMKEIHIIDLLTFTYISLIRVGFSYSGRIHLRHFFWNDSNLFIMVILPGRHTGEQCSNWHLTGAR